MQRTATQARRLRNALPVGLAALALGVGLSGCVSASVGTQAQEKPSIQAVQHPMLGGFPVPAGFELVEDRSYAKNVGELRLATCEFAGKADLPAVSRFYREYMPSAGFTLRQDALMRGEHIMSFDSRDERCTLRFRRERLRTILMVDISPAPRGAVEREEPQERPPKRKP